MKKFASLLIALALVLTSVSALAAVVPSKTSSDIAGAVALTEGTSIAVVDPDFLAQAEVERIRAAFISGAAVENLFNTEVATEIAGAKDVLDVVPVAVAGATEEETVSFKIYGANAFSKAVCVVGVYDSALNLYDYHTVPTECNADGSATITVDKAFFETMCTAESVVLAFVQM